MDVTERRIIADTLNVQGTGTGQGMIAMLEKQMASLGAPNWTLPRADATEDTAGAAGAILDDAGNAALDGADAAIVAASTPKPKTPTVLDPPRLTKGVDVLEVFLMTTDAGPDISKARQNIKCELHDDPNRIGLDCDCFAHQFHLITLALLWALDLLFIPASGQDFKYYTSLASLMHIMRDNMAEIYQAWADTYTVQDAIANGVHLVAPRPVSGRWAKVGSMENYTLGCDPAKLRKVLHIVLNSKNYWREQLEREMKEVDFYIFY